MVPGARRRFWASESDDPRSHFFRKISPDFVGARIVRIFPCSISLSQLCLSLSFMSIGTDVIRLSQTASALLEFYEDDVESWGIEGRVASFDHRLQAT